MSDALSWVIGELASINWLELIKAVAPVATAVIALLALKNWQRQDKAKREAEFLDALVDSVHAYIAQMPSPITLVEMAKIGMEAHAPTWEGGDQSVKGAILYIQKNGEADAKRLRGMREAVQPSATRLRSLGAKGQIFNFEGYVNCQNAIAMLTWQFDRIEAFMAIVGSPTWNWENPEVLKHLKNMMTLNPDDIRKSLQENNIAVLKFASETYRRIYD